MKLTDFIQNVGQPVAYYPGLRKITGGVTATILLCQFIYWRGKERDAEGWLYKTSSEIEDETGLTYNEQKTARALLKDAGLIEEHYARLDHKLMFRVNLDAVNEKWRMMESNVPECDDSMFGNDEKHHSLNELENTSEITSENTTEKQTAAVFSAYEKNIAVLVPSSASKLDLLIEEHPESWILEAIDIAVGRNKRNLKYIEGILRNWKESGKQDAKRPEQPAVQDGVFYG